MAKANPFYYAQKEAIKLITEANCTTCPYQEECSGLGILAEETIYSMGNVFCDPEKLKLPGNSDESAPVKLKRWVQDLTYRSLRYAHCMGRGRLTE